MNDADVGMELDRALRGSLPCIQCGYDLRGISIRGVCPECGTAVRAAILYQVDPKAEEFQPIVTPHVTAVSILAWSGAGLGAILVVWWIRLSEVMAAGLGRPLGVGWAPLIALALGAVSGVAVIGLIKPSRGTSLWHSAAAVVGGLAYVPVLWAFWEIQMIDARGGRPYMQYIVDPDRMYLRLVTDVSLVVVFLGLRPNLRELVRRSLAMRTGRVDRQTLLAMVGAVTVAAAGDSVRLVSLRFWPEHPEVLMGLGTLLVLVGSLFLTLGLVTAVIDAWRISRVILMPPPSLRQVLEGPGGGGERV